MMGEEHHSHTAECRDSKMEPLISSLQAAAPSTAVQDSISHCKSKEQCVNLLSVLEAYQDSFSEDQVWAITYQFVTLYRQAIVSGQSRTKDYHQEAGSGMRRTHSEKRPKRIRRTRSCTDDVTDAADDYHSMADHNDREHRIISDNESCCVSSDMEDEEEEAFSDNCGVSGDNRMKRRRSISSSNSSRRRCPSGSAGGDCSSASEDDKRLAEDQMDYLNVPTSLHNFCIHKDGTVHVAYDNEGECGCECDTERLSF